MSVRFSLEGIGRLARALQVKQSAIRDAVDVAVAQTAAGIQRRYVAAVQRGGRTGRTYKKYAPKRTHRASAPGEPPKTDTGQLANSCVIYHEQGSREALVVVAAPYAAALEFGSPKSNLAARPALGPAAKAETPAFRARMVRALDIEMRKGNRR